MLRPNPLVPAVLGRTQRPRGQHRAVRQAAQQGEQRIPRPIRQGVSQVNSLPLNL